MISECIYVSLGEGCTYFFASATALARMARFFSSTLMGLTATAGAIGAPGPAERRHEEEGREVLSRLAAGRGVRADGEEEG